MAVENIRHTQNLCRFQHGARKQREALGVIGIIPGGRAVKRVAIEVLGTLDKVKTYAGLASAGHHRGKAIFVVERNGDAAHHGRRIGQLGLPVTRQVDAHLMSQRGQCARQCAHHVRQSAGFRKRHTFRRHECDMHESLPGKTAFLRAHVMMDSCCGTEPPAQ